VQDSTVIVLDQRSLARISHRAVQRIRPAKAAIMAMEIPASAGPPGPGETHRGRLQLPGCGDVERIVAMDPHLRTLLHELLRQVARQRIIELSPCLQRDQRHKYYRAGSSVTPMSPLLD
jgi:hypothetical protein